jgi:hypothetical protein
MEKWEIPLLYGVLMMTDKELDQQAPVFCPTLKMSHDYRWRDSCASTRRDSCGRWL